MESLAVADPGQISIAVHEAGHAVVAILTGISVRYATLAARDGGAGVVLRSRRRGWPGQDSIAVSCAGMIAQDVAGTDQRWNIAEDGRVDVTHIRDVARGWHAASHGEAGTVLDLAARSWALAFDLVVDNYGAVLAVAEHLLSSRSALTGPEIRACMNGSPTVQPESAPPDGRTFWIPTYSGLRNWGQAARRQPKTDSGATV